MTDVGRMTMTSRESNATRLAFFVPGFCLGVWAPTIPYVKMRLGIDDGTLGGLLLCIGLGSIITMPISGGVAAKYGCRLPIAVSCIVSCLALLSLGFTPSLLTTAAALFVFGAAVGSADCVANIQAVIVQRERGRAMMSGFHGCFSAGGLIGAGGVALQLSAGFSTTECVLTFTVIAFMASLAAIPGSLPIGGEAGQAFAVPRPAILLIGVLCLIASLTEGAVLDWSAVFLSGTKGMDISYAGTGFVMFALIMTVGRLVGDVPVRILGARRIVILGGVFAATGLFLSVLSTSWHVAIFGFALVGVGIANLFPVLVSAAASQKVVPENVAVPAVLTLGYLGILMGPAVIGFLATLVEVSGALTGLAVLLLLVAVSGFKLPR